MQLIENQIQSKFRCYPFLVTLKDGFLYQLENCPRKRTRVFRKLTYNQKRDSWYFSGQLISRKRLLKLKIN